MDTKQKSDWMQFQTTLRCTVKDGGRVIHTSDIELVLPPMRVIGVIECKDGPLLFIEQGPLVVKDRNTAS